jgi:hypothetical protein
MMNPTPPQTAIFANTSGGTSLVSETALKLSFDGLITGGLPLLFKIN